MWSRYIIYHTHQQWMYSFSPASIRRCKSTSSGARASLEGRPRSTMGLCRNCNSLREWWEAWLGFCFCREGTSGGRD